MNATNGRGRLAGLVLASIGLALTLLLPFSAGTTRAVAADEAEFLAATLRVREGLVPYRDFWEHHLPLQWYAMAPWARVGDPPSVRDVLRMRAVQSVLWAAFGAAFVALLRRRGVSPPAALAGLALLSSAVLFASFAPEYRIDTPMTVVFLVGLLLAERSLDEEGPAGSRAAFLAGLAFALATLCSQRMAPLALAALVLYSVVRRDGEWGLRVRFAAGWGGAVAAAVVFLSLFAAAGAVGELVDQNVLQNASYEALAARDGAVRPAPWWPLSLALQARDAGTLVLLLLAAAAILSARRDLLSPRLETRLLLLLAAQAALLSGIRTPNPYQLETALALAALLAALAISRAEGRGFRPAVPLAFAAALACAALAWKETDLRVQADIARYQGHVLSAVGRLTAPGETVLEGGGLAWRRPSALEHWFLRTITISLTRHGELRPPDSRALREARPAVVVMDDFVRAWLPVAPEAGPFLSRNYLPLEREIWVPAPNALLVPGESARWEVLRSGAYAVAASRRLAGHPWFRAPFDVPTLGRGRADAFALDLSREAADPALRIEAGGRPVTLDGSRLLLDSGQLLVATNLGAAPLGVFVRPAEEAVLFRDPFPGIPLWPAATRP